MLITSRARNIPIAPGSRRILRASLGRRRACRRDALPAGATAARPLLPGVTVETTSPSLQGTRVVASGPDGNYHVPGVPPGIYAVQYELGGFGTVIREGIVAAVEEVAGKR